MHVHVCIDAHVRVCIDAHTYVCMHMCMSIYTEDRTISAVILMVISTLVFLKQGPSLTLEHTDLARLAEQ